MTDKQRLALLESAVDRLEKTRQGWVQAKDDLAKHGHWKAAMQQLRALEHDLKPPPKPPPAKVPALGPVFTGDKSLLTYSPTHQTSGLPLYAAFDGGWVKGKRVIAPELVTVTRHSGNSNSGFSLYATGKSGLKYYFQHMESAGRAAVGSKVAKGGKIGVIGDFVGANVPHLHLGINVEALAGNGKQLKYGKTGHGPDYTTGSPVIGAQLKEMT
jgi:Peptidase family M23